MQKEKALYTALNKLKKEDKLFLGFCWIPSQDVQKVLKDIEDLREKNNNIEIPTFKQIKEHTIRPPSLFRMNDFTFVFQEIVNTYGVPTYKEVNPSVFACVTFPFLFGVMFGDIGHGFVLFLVGSFLCLFEGPLREKAPGLSGLLAIRYLLLLMGLFATYCGIIYNDFMAIPLWVFNSCYELKEDTAHPAVAGHH